MTTNTERFISYRKYILQTTKPSQYRCTQLQYRFAVSSEAPSRYYLNVKSNLSNYFTTYDQKVKRMKVVFHPVKIKHQTLYSWQG